MKYYWISAQVDIVLSGSKDNKKINTPPCSAIAICMHLFSSRVSGTARIMPFFLHSIAALS
jgi:hypothetical protein